MVDDGNSNPLQPPSRPALVLWGRMVSLKLNIEQGAMRDAMLHDMVLDGSSNGDVREVVWGNWSQRHGGSYSGCTSWVSLLFLPSLSCLISLE